MPNVYDILKERGLIAQTTHEQEIRELLGKEKISFYIGFDPTADSLHVGHFLQMVVMRHMQQAGHRPIAIIGGGTAMIGDPTFKTDMRRMMSREEIRHNADRFKKQMSKFIEFGEDKALMLDNGDWLLNLNYIQFLRDVGVHFSVNNMLRAECFKSRLERGLSFIEFNYMLMQSFDFLKLYQEYGCKMELGGNDQWSNILGGIDLVRRVEGKEVYGMTFTLLTTSDGKKMGKTEKGAVWLDPEKTTPYEFYQYWRNVQDEDVIHCLKLITFLPMDEIRRMEDWEGAQLNEAKRVLAYEVTKLVHGEAEAEKARATAEALFVAGGGNENMPSTRLAAVGMGILEVLVSCGLCPSKSEARRLVTQGGVALDGEKVTDPQYVIPADKAPEFVIKKGKKVYHKVLV